MGKIRKWGDLGAKFLMRSRSRGPSTQVRKRLLFFIGQAIYPRPWQRKGPAGKIILPRCGMLLHEEPKINLNYRYGEAFFVLNVFIKIRQRLIKKKNGSDSRNPKSIWGWARVEHGLSDGEKVNFF